MKLQYIGTAAAEAIPGMFCECEFCEEARKKGGKEIRRRSGAVIDDTLLIDLSPDTCQGAYALGIRLSKIRNLLITHSHEDHCCISELIYRKRHSFCILPEERENLHVYGNRAVTKLVRQHFPIPSEYNFTFDYLEPYRSYGIGGYTVTALPVNHANEDAYIYLIEKDGHRLLYGNDSGMFPDETFEYLRNRYCHMVSLDCTMGYQDHDVGHMGFPANLRVKDRMIDLHAADENTVFISHHFSHNGLRAPNRLLTYEEFSEMAKPHGFLMSYDGMTVEI